MTERWMTEIMTTAVVSGLILIAQHYIPWRKWLRIELPAVVRYVMGILGLFIPLTVLFSYWRDVLAVIAIWVVVVFAGGFVIVAYALDSWFDQRDELRALRRDRKTLRARVDSHAHPE